MKTLRTQRRLAAQLLNVGTNRVWFDPGRLQEIREAITKQDILALIKDGAIKKKPPAGMKKRAHKKRLERKRKGRKRGKGKIKKRIKERKKEIYVHKIRKLRNYLKKIKGKIPKEKYNQIKKWIKGGKIKEIKEIKALEDEGKI